MINNLNERFSVALLAEKLDRYNTHMLPAIFLDRDGVIIENRSEYVRSWADVRFLPGALPTLARLKDSPYVIVIITNQAGIGRGLISLQTAEQINAQLIREIEAAGGRVDGLFMCPHKPDDGCDCRKPQPGLILQAARALDIRLEGSLIIGDNLSDLQAGMAARVGQVVLVRTGLGAEFASQLKAAGLSDTPVYNDLAQALTALVKSA